MTQDEQIQICKTIAISCMWGQGGIASVILERLDKEIPMPDSWTRIYSDNAKQAKREHMGVITDERKLLALLRSGYWLVNGDSLFNPSPMNGLYQYVDETLYKKYAPRY